MIFQGETQKSKRRDFSKFRVGVVTARFNNEITSKLESGALQFLKENGFEPSQLAQIRVPGAVEIPLAAKELLDRGFDGVVALGAVIRGDTAHFDYVCQSVERGCTLLQLEYCKPVGFGVLTTENEEQAFARAGGEMGNKGYEAAEVVLEMLDLKSQLTNAFGAAQSLPR